MTTVYNFCAGPAMLPRDVMQQAQQEFINWQGIGSSVMEISHRSPEFLDVAAQAEQDLRDLMKVPDNYKVLFMHGGGRGQFSAVPLNLATRDAQADYLVSGSWSDTAVIEAQKYLKVNVVSRHQKVDGKFTLTDPASWQLASDAAYFHYCPNETVDGIEMHQVPDVNVPIVADMSSCILSKTINVSDYGVIYAGAQKNIGPSGLAVVIVREDLLNAGRPDIPCIFDYAEQAKQGSMLNTPPTYAWYLAGLVFKWLKQNGGVAAMEQTNAQKAALLYSCIDSSDFYLNQVDNAYRSRMNVPFQLADERLDKTFLAESEQQGLVALKGHRSVGGMRASIYNAMPLEGVVALTEFMQDFARRHG